MLINEEAMIKGRIAYYRSHIRSVETIFTHRMELMPYTRKQCIQRIENTRKECEAKILKLEDELKKLQNND